MKLIICEKPSVGAAIAAALGISKRKDGYIEGTDHIVSWCIGHLVGLADAGSYEERYKKWSYEDLPILPDPFRFVLSPDKEEQFAVLKGLMEREDVDGLINACDAGREGELIFRLVADMAGCGKPIYRLWISSMEEKAIREGFENLKPGAMYDALYQSALCRQQADWLVGINATRLFSVLYHRTLSVGRVQTPTLSMLAERDRAISMFTKEKYHVVRLSFDGIEAAGGRTGSADEAEEIRNSCQGSTAVCTHVEKEIKTVKPPKLFDLTALQREANRLYGYTAKQTLDSAQSLYEKKLITYPRTDSRYLTSDMAGTAEDIIRLVSGLSVFPKSPCHAPEVSALLSDKDVSDHHAVIPTAELGRTDVSSLPLTERNLLLLISCRLLCASAPSHVYEAVTGVFECGGMSFTARGKTTVEAGFTEILLAFKASLKEKPEDEDTDGEDVSLPELTEGRAHENVSASVTEHYTAPPKAYTEDTLLAAMERAGAADMPEDAERKGLGTPATRAGIIEKLVSGGFVERKGKSLIPTKAGLSLVSVLPDVLTSPALTAEWEQRLSEIAKGNAEAPDFMEDIRAMTADLVKNHSHISEDGQKLFAPEHEAVGTCPRCGEAVYEGKKNFYCGNRGCTFVLWKKDRFWTSRKKELTKKMAEELLKKGRTKVKGMYSEKKDSTYDATVVLADTGGKYINFKLEFDNSGKGKGGKNGK